MVRLRRVSCSIRSVSFMVLWNEDTWWSDSREGNMQGTRRQFSSLLTLMRRELPWSWCCCSGLFLCASVHPFSFHLLQTLATKEEVTNKTKAFDNVQLLLILFNTVSTSSNVLYHVKNRKHVGNKMQFT